MEHVLLTGFPGFLAEHLIQCSQKDRQPVFWHLIVLPDQVSAACQCLRSLNLNASQYAIYPGDITQPNLGLPPEDAHALQSRVQRCFHLAALYDLTAAPEISDAVNINGTKHVLEFLLNCPNLQKFNYISTCYISGLLEGPIPEDSLSDPPAFRNEYERTKQGAEKVVRDYLDKIPTTIFRPAIVIGDSKTGSTAKFDGPYVLIRFFKQARPILVWMPDLGFDNSWLNTVPIDFVAAVLHRVGFSGEFVGKTIQIADPAAPTTSECFKSIYQQITGRTCVNAGNLVRRIYLRLLQVFPIDLITGIPPQTVEYFYHRGNYQTENLQDACRRFDIQIPKWTNVYKSVINFAMSERRHAPNAGVIRKFKRWCACFQLIFAALALVILAAPAWLTAPLAAIDNMHETMTLTPAHLLGRPLAVALPAALAIALAFLRRNPFQKSMHVLLIAVQLISAVLFFGFAAGSETLAPALCGLILAILAVFHLLFSYRLATVRPMV